jgi:hypothetical protein
MEKFVVFITPRKGESGYLKSYASSDIYAKTSNIEHAMTYASPADAMVHAVSIGEKFNIIRVKVTVCIEHVVYVGVAH